MILVDTGFWIALSSPNDHNHKQSVKVLESITEPLITTWPVLTETFYLLIKRRCFFSATELLSMLEKGVYSAFELTSQNHISRLKTLIRKYKNLPIDLADASLIIAAEEFNSAKILSTDVRDFNVYRWKGRKSFHNLLY